LTIKTPKPLLIIKNLTLLDHCINLIIKLNIKKVLINSFYLKEQINEFVRNHNYNIEIKVIEDGENILDTGGGILNLIDKSEKLIFKKNFIKVIKNLIKKLHYKNVTFVHRDFHVSNLMIFKNEIAVIDTQDALIGNKAYDLASLIDDVRFKTSKNTKKKLFNYYLKSQKKINKLHIKNDFEIISVLRNLKIIGIFKRLAVRDKKKKYLKLIPNAWNLIKLRSKNNDKFKNLNDLLGTIKKN